MKRASKKTKSKVSRRSLTVEEVVVANVIRLRKERGWTQYDLAAKLGRFQPWVNRLERGRSVPTLRTLADLAGAFEVDISEFVKE